MNINTGSTKYFQERNAEQTKPLSMQFPVSSGQLHRKKESDWAPYSKSEQQPHHFAYGHNNNNNNSNNIPRNVMQPMPIPVAFPGQPMMVQPSLGSSMLPPQHHQPPLTPCSPGQLIPYPTHVSREQMYPSNNVQYGVPQGFEDHQLSGFGSNVDALINHRVPTMKRAQHSFNDGESRVEMNRTQESQGWVQPNHETGHFTGMVGARFLSQTEMTSGTQAWARRDQLIAAAPLQSSSMGMAMLQKMGWKPGEGLGKNKEGAVEPLNLQIKMDKKGLVASDEVRGNQSKDIAKNFYEGKHPVSLLNEVCLRNRYGPPLFDCCYETGQDNKKNFVFKVTVNGVEHKPASGSQNKKHAKVEAATLCLKNLGLI